MSNLSKLIELLENQQKSAIQANTQGQVEQQYQFLKGHMGGSKEDKTSTFSTPHPSLPQIRPHHSIGNTQSFKFEEHQVEQNISAAQMGLKSLAMGQKLKDYNRDIHTERELKTHQTVAQINAGAAGLTKYNVGQPNQQAMSNRKTVYGERGEIDKDYVNIPVQKSEVFIQAKSPTEYMTLKEKYAGTKTVIQRPIPNKVLAEIKEPDDDDGCVIC